MAWGRLLYFCKQGKVIPMQCRTAVMSSIRSASTGSTKDSWVPQEKKTHTGQEWEADDYRLVRFIDKPKQINTEFAIDLIDKVPPAPREDRVVWCDGGGGPTGHPRVYINLDKPGNHICGYCGLRFTKEDHH